MLNSGNAQAGSSKLSMQSTSVVFSFVVFVPKPHIKCSFMVTFSLFPYL